MSSSGCHGSCSGNQAEALSSSSDDYYQWGRLAYQTTGAGTLLARYTYDLTGAPVSVQVGSDPTTAPRYYYVYDARGDVVNLTDASGATVASYAYDTWGALTASSESIPGAAAGWVNPYRYDGRDRVLADPASGLDWLATRAYDPTTGRFLARDPLGRVPLFFADNPYAYAGNNPLSNVDPSGQYRAAGHDAATRESGAATNAMMAKVVVRVMIHHGTPGKANKSTAGKAPGTSASGMVAKTMAQVPASLLSGCNLCAAIVNALAKIEPVVVIGTMLILIGVVADTIALGMIMKAGLDNPELAPMILSVLAILGSISVALDSLAAVTTVFSSGPLAGIIHGLLALIDFMASALRLAVPIAIAGGWAVAFLRIGLLGTVETAEGEAAPLDAAVSIFVGLQVASWMSAGASFLMGVGESLVAWGYFHS